VSEPTLVQQLGVFAEGALADGVPNEVLASTRQRVLDVVGLCLAAVPLETSQAVIGYAQHQGGREEATAVGAAVRLPAAQAAFVNGVLAHSLDYDDTHLPSILHPSASVVPAALAAGEAHGRSGRDVLVAAAVGIEVAVRLGMAGYDRESANSLFFERGQHATSIVGGLGSAAAAALLAGLGASGVAHAIGVAASMTSGIIEANRTGGTVKRTHCGWAAHAGVTAAELVARGVTGPPTVLEGRFGFFQAWLDGRFVASEITDGLGSVWSVPGIFFKPYPANHFTHAGIDAARRLRAAGLRPDDVEHALLEVAPPTVRTIGEPIADKRSPESGYHAKFSGPYTVAAALHGGGGLGLGLADFSDAAAARPEVRDLMQRIDVAGDPALLDIYPHQFPARLTVTTRDGSRLVEEVLVNRGGPDDPLTDDELAAKFADNAAVTVDDVTAKAIRNAIDTIADAPDIAAALAPLRT
jgi:2-methylcitrate dehydratase PrpD